jgi:hypothetical protein
MLWRPAGDPSGMVNSFNVKFSKGPTYSYLLLLFLDKGKNGGGEGNRTLVTPRVADCAPQSGNIRYIVVSQALKWQQNWQQTGNRLATHQAGATSPTFPARSAPFPSRRSAGRACSCNVRSLSVSALASTRRLSFMARFSHGGGGHRLSNPLKIRNPSPRNPNGDFDARRCRQAQGGGRCDQEDRE